MAIGSSGEIDLNILVSDLDDLPLLVASAFGTSMLPFLKPGATLRLEPAEVASIRRGDVVTFKSKPGVYVTHRVVKILGDAEDITFLTKGDNRLNCDPVISGHQISGRVIQVNRTNIRSFGWIFLGVGMAWISYAQYIFCQRLAESDLNRIRHTLEKKGWCPRLALRDLMGNVLNPVRWFIGFFLTSERTRIRRLRRKLSRQGIRIIPGPDHVTESMIHVWNEAYPHEGATSNDLNPMLCEVSGSATPAVFLAKSADDLLGWMRLRTGIENSEARQGIEIGLVDRMALTPGGWAMHLDQVLFLQALEWFHERSIRKIFFNPEPMRQNPWGISLTPVLIAAAEFGFEPVPTHAVQNAWRRE